MCFICHLSDSLYCPGPPVMLMVINRFRCRHPHIFNPLNGSQTDSALSYARKAR